MRQQAEEDGRRDVSVFSATIDQTIAQKIGQENLLPSMQLNVEDPGPASSNCGEGYSCMYTNSISWVSGSQPLPMELNPQVVFERLFGDGSTAELRAARRSRDRSILDSLGDTCPVCAVKFERLGHSPHRRILENIREIERRLQIAMQASTVAPSEMTVPVECRRRSTSTSSCSSICSRWRSAAT